VGFLSSAVGLSLIGLSVGMPMVFAGAFFSGFGMSSLLGIGPLDITGTIPRERASMGISWFAIAIFFGSFITPYVVNPLTDLFRQDSIRTRFIVSGALLFVQAVLYETIRRRYFSADYDKMETRQFGGETAALADSGNGLSVPDEAAGALCGVPADQTDTS
jgi:MFS family permease